MVTLFAEPAIKWNLHGAIFELSGFALDKKKNELWTLGDSGTGAFIAKVNTTDGKSSRIKVKGAKNLDWEALVLEEGKEPALWILDVGDNKKVRKIINFYRVKTSDIHNNLVQAEKFELSYPESSMDCEAAVIKDDSIYLFEKTYYLSPRVYSVSLKKLPLVAKLLGQFPKQALITDASLTADNRLFVLTYTGINEIENWLQPEKSKIKNVVMDQWGQTEALVALSPNQFWVGREDGKVFEIRVP